MLRNNIQKNYHIHISAKHRLLDLKLKDVWEYRDLIWLFAKRNFTIYYKQTILGPAWLILNPLITGLMYAFVFGGIAKIGTDGVPGILFYLSGTAIWSFFSSSLTMAPLMRPTKFPEIPVSLERNTEFFRHPLL